MDDRPEASALRAPIVSDASARTAETLADAPEQRVVKKP